jgi:hypothetical protein
MESFWKRLLFGEGRPAFWFSATAEQLDGMP